MFNITEKYAIIVGLLILIIVPPIITNFYDITTTENAAKEPLIIEIEATDMTAYQQLIPTIQSLIQGIKIKESNQQPPPQPINIKQQQPQLQPYGR